MHLAPYNLWKCKSNHKLLKLEQKCDIIKSQLCLLFVDRKCLHGADVGIMVSYLASIGGKSYMSSILLIYYLKNLPICECHCCDLSHPHAACRQPLILFDRLVAVSTAAPCLFLLFHEACIFKVGLMCVQHNKLLV